MNVRARGDGFAWTLTLTIKLAIVTSQLSPSCYIMYLAYTETMHNSPTDLNFGQACRQIGRAWPILGYTTAYVPSTIAQNVAHTGLYDHGV